MYLYYYYFFLFDYSLYFVEIDDRGQKTKTINTPIYTNIWSLVNQ